MEISVRSFHILARALGALLLLMGAFGLATFVAFLTTGANVLESSLELDAAGMLLLATIGAFQLALGASLFSRDSRAPFRLRVAALALGLMGMLRLMAFLHTESRMALGSAPLVEFAVFMPIAALALVVRPAGQSAIEIMRTFQLDVSASAAWTLIADRFGEVHHFASGVRHASLEGPVGVGCVRTCTSEPFGPFKSSKIREELIEYDPDAMRYTYVAGGELPAFIPASKNRWSVRADGDGRCFVACHASVELAPWATFFAPILSWAIGGAVERFGADLRKALAR